MVVPSFFAASLCACVILLSPFIDYSIISGPWYTGFFFYSFVGFFANRNNSRVDAAAKLN